MVRTTKAQRKALKAVFDRIPLMTIPQTKFGEIPESARLLTYREFRKEVQPTFGMDGAIVIQWAGMWLAIETDGYTHS